MSLRTERLGLLANIARTERRFDEMRDLFLTGEYGTCCHKCAFGYEYTLLAHKQERRRERVAQIDKKLETV